MLRAASSNIFCKTKSLKVSCGMDAHQIGKSTKYLQCSELPRPTISARQKGWGAKCGMATLRM